MFRDLKEYQDIQKLYEEQVSKPENLEERRGSSPEQLKKNRDKLFPATPPQKGFGGGVGNPTNQRGTGFPKDKKTVTPPETKAPETKAPETTPTEPKGGETKTEPKPMSTKDKFNAKFIKKVKGKGFVRRGTPGAQRAENKEKNKMRAQEMARQRIAAKKKAAMSEGASVEYDAYDLVLEYLLSSEQVTTIEEANYVMTEMDAETIQAIVEEQKKNLMKDF